MNYKDLYFQSMRHLRIVSGSRNSFTPEAREVLGKHNVTLRELEVERMQAEAARFVSHREAEDQRIRKEENGG